MQLELKKLQNEVGITFIYVTHDQEEALTMSDRVAVMSNGLVEQVGTPDDIYENPQSAFVANFIGVSNIYLSQVKEVRDGVARCVTDRGMPVLVSTHRHEDIKVGDHVGVVVRPEKMRITLPQHGSEIGSPENVYAGVVKAVVYIGSVTQFIVSVEGKHLAQVLQQNLFRSEGREWHAEQTVEISFGVSSCALITDIEGGMAEKDLMGEVVKRM